MRMRWLIPGGPPAPRLLALVLAAIAATGACGDGERQQGDDGATAATIAGCDTVQYDGVTFERIGCARGHSGFSVAVEEGEVFAELDVLCADACIAAVVTRNGSADGGERAGDAGSGGGAFGDACGADTDCEAGLFCDIEQQVSSPILDLPGGVPDVLRLIFPGGSCTPIPITPYGPNSCDPGQPQALQGCGPDGVCIPEPGFEQDFVACRQPCEPSADSSGCDRKFYTCDFSVKACVEGCQSDDECRAQVVDSDGDGDGDALAYDSLSEALCDDVTRRCTHPGAGGGTGGACERVDDCESDGICLDVLQTFGGHVFPGGSCSKIGCGVSGRECGGADAICTTARTTRGGSTRLEACFSRCEVGAEAPEDVVGEGGHGAGCRSGYRCHYNGGAVDEGICVGGTYTEVTEPNVGAACEDVDSCYSGYGLGRCIQLALGQDIVAPTGVCTLMDCAAPGLPDEVCGQDATCIVLDGDMTFCVQTCEAAEECADGFACVDQDMDPETPKVCYPACTEDAECRDSETCDLLPAGNGTCGS